MRPQPNSRHPRRASRRLARHPLPLALAVALATPLAQAQAPPPGQLPEGGSVVSGSASITLPGGNTMNIAQTTQGAIIDWGTFSIGSAATVNFVQPGAAGVTLNRVIGTPLSQIFGGLNANGRVFIVNPSGVLFGAGSQVNVGGLVASTLSISNANFNAGVASGSFAFGLATETPPGDVTVQSGASLTAAPGGTLALLGNQNIINGGALTADSGSVIMAQGRQITLDFFGDGLTQVTLNSSEETAAFLSIENSTGGVIQADGGQVVLTSNTGPLLSGSGNFTILNQGQIRAQTLENREGRIVLSGPNGFVDVGGTLDATGAAAGQQGGTIEIEGDNVQIAGSMFDVDCAGADSNCTVIDASGHSGGGAITVASTDGTAVVGSSSDDETTAVQIRSDALAVGSAGTVAFTKDGGATGAISVAGTVLVSASGLGAASGGEIRLVNSGSGGISLLNFSGESFVGPVDILADGASGGGTIELDAAADADLVVAEGTLLSATSSGGVGGSIDLFGETIGIEGNTSADLTCADAGNLCTRIDASGSAGGGAITIASTFSTDVFADNDGGPATDDSVQIRSDALASGSGGTITFANAGAESEAGLPGGTSIAGAALISAEGLGTASGGTIGVTNEGGAIFVSSDSADESFAGPVDFIADGASAGGSISLVAGTELTFSPPTGADLFTLSADATGSGAGGQVRTVAGDILDLRGIEVSAGGPAGAGAWEIQSGRGLAVVDGLDEFGPPGGVSLVSDDSIGGALSAGTDVDITVPAAGGGVFPQINIAPGVAIANTGALPVAFSLTAAGGQVLAGVNPDGTLGAWSIGSSTGPLDLSIDALSSVGLYQGTVQTNGGAIEAISRNSSTFGVEVGATTLDSGGGDVNLASLVSEDIGVAVTDSTINTDGGALTLQALDSGADGVTIADSTLDTRVGQNAANAGGALTVEGNSRGESGFNVGVALNASNLRGSTGNIAITGRAAGTFSGDQATGVSVSGGELLSTSGAIAVTGIASAAPDSGASTRGASVNGAVVASGTGDITMAGYGGIGTLPSLGLGIGDLNPTQISTDGAISLAGSSRLGSGIIIGNGSSVRGDRQIVLRAQGGSGQDGLVIDGTVASATAVNLRPGTVSLAGAVTDSVGDAIQVGGADGFALSAAELANIDTPDLVIGHAAHAGAISIAEALTRAGNVTLQNTGGAGGIALNAAVNLGSGTLALVSGGDITQTAAGGITAQSLLARSTGGSVDLTAGQNDVSGSTLAGGAAGDFGYIDINALTIGNVTARGFDAAGQAATDLAESGADAGDAVFVRNNAGDLTLGADVSGTDVDLVTAGRLQNSAGADIVAGNRWRVWADTFVGETRGGLVGSGTLPNLYNCSFGGPCGVTVPADGDHFIYREQPTATIDIASFTREYGLANPALLFTVAGLILGDQAANAILGAPSTTAVLDSDVGTYPIAGSFISPAGYAIQLNPGTLDITRATLTLVADPFSRIYGDPNGLFTGAVLGFRAGDTLADLAGTLVFSTDADQTSDVGRYGIFGSGIGSLNYNILNAAANATALTITPATLTYVADPFTLLFGGLFGPFTGTVTGFRNGDTLANDTTGTLLFSTTVGPDAPPGAHPILGGGLDALNYAFVQDPANFTALRVDFVPPTQVVDLIRETTDTYVYDRNIGTAPMCLATGPLDSTRQDQQGDALGREWSKVRTRPNLTSCVSSERKNSCGDF